MAEIVQEERWRWLKPVAEDSMKLIDIAIKYGIHSLFPCSFGGLYMQSRWQQPRWHLLTCLDAQLRNIQQKEEVVDIVGEVSRTRVKLLVPDDDDMLVPREIRTHLLCGGGSVVEWDEYVVARQTPVKTWSNLQRIDSIVVRTAVVDGYDVELRDIVRELMVNPYCDAEFLVWLNTQEIFAKQGAFGAKMRLYEHTFAFFGHHGISLY